MKRYLVFIFEEIYPEGGGDDFALATDDLNEAQAKAQTIFGASDEMKAHVFDARAYKVVFRATWSYRTGKAKTWVAPPANSDTM